MASKNGFSVIIPIFNEGDVLQERIETLMKFLIKIKRPYEVVLGDNGSVDNTKKIGKILEDEYKGKVRFYFVKEKGVGNGVKIAIKKARYQYVIEMPIDFSIDKSFIPSCLQMFDKGYSIVIGSKKMGNQKRDWYKKILSFGYILLIRFLLNLKFTDYSVGAKGYKKSVILDRLNSIDKSSFYVTDFIYFANKKGKKIIEIPVYCIDQRKSKFNLSTEVFYRLKNIFTLWFFENFSF